MKLLKAIIPFVMLVNSSILAPFEEILFEQDLFSQLKINLTIDSDFIDTLNNKLAQCGYKSLFKYSDSNSLFLAYPKLQTKLPYISYASLPTPLEKLEELSNRYNTQI